MVAANRPLQALELTEKGTPKDKGEHPAHIVVVIKYVPAIGDSKRTIYEYFSEIFCGGLSVVNIFNECEDYLLAELLYSCQVPQGQRARVQALALGPVFALLHARGSSRQTWNAPRSSTVSTGSATLLSVEAFLKACLGLEGSIDLSLETRLW
ncbi:hypothetical protein FA15DRAFT_175346 [Coprinopsis marcescibilis]|uniref:inositol-3-phosphate synthase n=1 Tax=Coprinopsis marcescibilis TaxID=230819 RepID=A0A5C3KGU3_COPMA|nr:hypothetical protein FA15DRAFT_175346 [Coprinopsis marcescibilis]